MLQALVIQRDPERAESEVMTWKDILLVTPKHEVWQAWNEAAIYKHCQETKERIYKWSAEDIVKGKPLTPAEKYALALWGNQKW